MSLIFWSDADYTDFNMAQRFEDPNKAQAYVLFWAFHRWTEPTITTRWHQIDRILNFLEILVTPIALNFLFLLTLVKPLLPKIAILRITIVKIWLNRVVWPRTVLKFWCLPFLSNRDLGSKFFNERELKSKIGLPGPKFWQNRESCLPMHYRHVWPKEMFDLYLVTC